MAYIVAVRGYGMWEFKTRRKAESFAKALSKKDRKIEWAIARC